MFEIHLFLLTFKIVGTAVNTYLAYKIARTDITPTVTYSLFAFGFGLRLFTYIGSLFFTKSIFGFFDTFHPGIIIFSQIIEVMIVIAFMVGFAKKYGYLRTTYPSAT